MTCLTTGKPSDTCNCYHCNMSRHFASITTQEIIELNAAELCGPNTPASASLSIHPDDMIPF